MKSKHLWWKENREFLNELKQMCGIQGSIWAGNTGRRFQLIQKEVNQLKEENSPN